ncbi:hypothetical protein KSC_039650 [Ktedonobacter sp. SOSP1-52]|uniref:Hsp70 family protein n=1 Tax=Ktedonobacter sp. SOSP1-52 TaxID=2778366 RepID=UPI00191588D0|nr:Hsp70 family protein [Ktedonobacter sp. SOSP1-52]GHO65073.1 hypothetical protein KSC_039650 [Ktedonobacter sp. SOSP1-52]
MVKQIISKAVGIDLGTTNSVVALMNEHDTEIIIHSDAKRETTPSCVWKDRKTGEIVVGRRAVMRIGSSPEPIKSIKRKMGTQEKVRLTNEDRTPEEISSFILAEMKRQIEEDVAKLATNSTEWIVDRAIITVPAYFDQPQIDATRKAGEMAGLQVLELLHEPTAAACHYCWETNTQNGIFLVYDLGGGTFDVSILRCTEGEFEVLAINGNTQLGGDDFDTVLAEEILERLIREGYDLNLDRQDPADQERIAKLKRLAEGVKIALSTATETTLRSTTDLQDKSGEWVDIDMEFERQDVEKIVKPMIERSFGYLHEALEQAQQKAGVTLADIDAIILAGGSTHIPLVREMIKQNFCADPTVREKRAKCSEPVYKKVDTIVALGAAIRAAATGGLAVYNPEKTVRVSFRGMSATGARQTHIAGTIEALTPELNLEKGLIRLSVPDLHYEDEQELKKNGNFGFTRVRLQPADRNLLNFTIYDSYGTSIATIERFIYQSEEALRPTGGSAGTAIAPKEIRLDVNHNGKVESKILIEALGTLPVSKTHTDLFIPENADTIRLPIYQKNKKIQEIHLPNSYTASKSNTAEITVTMDKLSHITVKGRIGSEVFELEVTLLPPDQLPTDEEVQALDTQFLSGITSLPANQRHLISAKYRHAKKGYEDALKREDEGQCIHEYEEMKEIVTSMARHQVSLKPDKSEFDSLGASCIQLNMQLRAFSGQLPKSYNYSELATTINEHRSQGEKAFNANDQIAYSESFNMLESIKGYLSNLLWEVNSATDTRTESEKAKDYSTYAAKQAADLEQLAQSQGHTQLQKQLQQIQQQLEGITKSVQYDPQGVSQKAIQSLNQLEQIQNILKSSTEPTDTQGLLEYRG